ncbi:possible secreted peptidase [Actinomycetales bacterium JB111]|nr:possible secreted peptidase [Actinomycetales bacterium JB111]
MPEHVPTLDVTYPFDGSWEVRNSPANRVPSHGTRLFGSAHAIDFVPVVDGRSAPFTPRSLLRPEPPESFPGFGHPILAPLAGIVLAADDDAHDHPAYRGLPSVGYALTQGRRAARGWPALAGNHVLIEHDGVVVALCHLMRGSVDVHPGDAVEPGAVVGRCGNSGNSMEPHVHVQAIDGPDARRAGPVALTFEGGVPRNGEIVVGRRNS